jgi:CRP-like cAMP-binding protein
MIFEQGDPAFGLYCLCLGRVKLWRWTRNGRCQLLTVLESPGVLLGTEALIEHHRDYAACALEDSQLYFVAREEFALLPGLELLKAQAQLLVQLERRLAETLGRGAQERLARLLLNNSGNSLLKLGELAALAGLSVEHTCRLLKQLERRGWIRHSGRAIEILNPKALEGLL